MTCPNCGSASYSRADHPRPTNRNGITFRAHVCSGCTRTFLSAQLVITDEFEPVTRLDETLKALMDESDARARDEIEDTVPLDEVDE